MAVIALDAERYRELLHHREDALARCVLREELQIGDRRRRLLSAPASARGSRRRLLRAHERSSEENDTDRTQHTFHDDPVGPVKPDTTIA